MKKCDICKYEKKCPDIVEIDSVYCMVHRTIPRSFYNEYIEKQQLISFLEDKIKENLLNKEYTYSGNFWFYKGKEEAYEEILDFIYKRW